MKTHFIHRSQLTKNMLKSCITKNSKPENRQAYVSKPLFQKLSENVKQKASLLHKTSQRNGPCSLRLPKNPIPLTHSHANNINTQNFQITPNPSLPFASQNFDTQRNEAGRRNTPPTLSKKKQAISMHKTKQTN